MATIEQKIRTIRFLLLSFVLFTACDICGLLFVPRNMEVPPMLRITCWFTAVALGALLFYGYRGISSPRNRIIAASVGIICYVSLLFVTGFFRSWGPYTGGYKAGFVLMPFVGLLWCRYAMPLYKWYCRTFARITGGGKASGLRNMIGQGVLLLTAVLALLLLYGLRGSLASAETDDTGNTVPQEEVNPNQDHREPYRRYDTIFNDLQDQQIVAAMANGLSGPITAEQAEQSRQLEYIGASRFFKVDRLTHSVPYLVPKAADLLEDMGRAFQDSLYNRGYSRQHRFIVTSVLRTEESVRQLMRTNVNATENSCHCYGTTFDIAYYRYEVPESGKVADQEKMRQVLMQVAYDMRSAGRCYVKYEKQQSCLHVTVR